MELLLDRLTKHYGNKIAVDCVSATLKPGVYGLLGANGAGKTTLMRMLCAILGSTSGEVLLNGKEVTAMGADYRNILGYLPQDFGYYPNYKGNITINDHELNDYSSEQINKKISIVQQDVFIFDDSLKANLTLGREFTDEQLNSAIQRAGLSEFVYKNGLDYICGEDGNNLSGGEKQRISIARTLLRDSGVIFFDEVTSSLDNCTTIAIEETIKSLDKTCIAITHKLNLNVLRNYDEVLVFKEGKLVESGTVDELIENNQYFYSLYTFSK